MDELRGYELSIIFGISGVGKTTACNSARKDLPEFLHLSSSDLLKRAHTATGEALRTAPADRLQANQNALAKAVAEEAQRTETAHILLDAHSVIDNDVALVDIPVDAISALRPTRMVFLFDDPDAIVARREADSRSRPSRTSNELALHQQASLAQCRQYEDVLNLPLFIVRATDISALVAALRNS